MKWKGNSFSEETLHSATMLVVALQQYNITDFIENKYYADIFLQDKYVWMG